MNFSKKVSPAEKKALVRHYMAKGLIRDKCLEICQMSKHKLYYQSKGKKRGRTSSQSTLLWKAGEWREVSNAEVVTAMHAANEEAEEAQGYQRMCAELQLRGFQINRKKVYRLMKENNMLHPKRKAGGQKHYVCYRIVMPEEPLQLVEMDIKQV
ncbi:MAG: hypothetical protein KatS3mg031_3064 [Chitinophagales bacterium]|nr:MAG: hypothetical protein KatS3mg031_3064 [Chitinophagales bacterium]